MDDWSATLAALGGAALTVAHVAVCVAALGVIPGNRKPSTGMAWLLLVLAVPFVGLVVFLLFGSTHVERRRRNEQAAVNRLIHARTAEVRRLVPAEPRLAYQASVATLNRNLGALPTLDGNTVELYSDYGESIRAMTEAVERATRFVHVQFYITAWDSVTEPFFLALQRATERGVAVRLLFDHLGSRGIPSYQETLRRLEKVPGVQWRPMLPIDPLHGKFRRPDLRNHRKILVVDGETGFTGSQNLIEPCYDKPKNQRAGRAWVELTAQVHGPVVAALNAVFLTDWFTETEENLAEAASAPALEAFVSRVAGEASPAVGVRAPSGGRVVGGPVSGVTAQVVPSGPGFVTENNLRMFTTLLYSAQERISITSPYFVPDESLLYAVTTAALRGVDVELFVSAVGDQFMVHHAQCSYYQALLEAGVRIYLYPAPYVLHSKHFTVDDDVAVLGSSNMDMRSFALNYEVSLMLLGGDVVARMREVEDTYRSLSRELTAEEWAGRGFRSRYVDNVMRLTAALQ